MDEGKSDISDVTASGSVQLAGKACPKCNYFVSPDDKVCPFCGAKLTRFHKNSAAGLIGCIVFVVVIFSAVIFGQGIVGGICYIPIDIASNTIAHTSNNYPDDLDMVVMSMSNYIDDDGLEIYLDAVEADYARYINGKHLTRVEVSYVNRDRVARTFNILDWQAEDENGAWHKPAKYASGDMISAGTLEPNEMVRGSIYFEGKCNRTCYFSSDTSFIWEHYWDK